VKYADLITDWLADAGYSHCFHVAGGNIMHLLEAVERRLHCVPFVHELSAAIAAEYFNEVEAEARAFALVTAGPGLTHLVSALAGAYLESRALLVIGGQVKTGDLANGGLRQRGIQEVDGVAIAAPITVRAERLLAPLDRASFLDVAEAGRTPRRGPVFIEIPLDVQGRDVDPGELERATRPSPRASLPGPSREELDRLVERVRSAGRPVLLLGGEVSRGAAAEVAERGATPGVPIMTTWNGADRIDAAHPLCFGRPNTWGPRYANLLLQQADLLVAMGARLGFQQTGFCWRGFVPNGRVAQVHSDPNELAKGHPRVEWPLLGDADHVLRHLLRADLGDHGGWLDYCREVKAALPLNEARNPTREGYVSPYALVECLSRLCRADDVVIPCSSGGAFTMTMQTFEPKAGQVIVTNEGLAAMGYGLGGAIGAALAGGGRRTILVEGDGGFAQNLQEIGTAAIHRLNLKLFVLDNGGYGSIAAMRRSHFGRGRSMRTIGLPDWEILFAAWGVEAMRLGPGFERDAGFRARFEEKGPSAFIVPIDPEQTHHPRIASRVLADGEIVSDPLHRMSPPLDEAVQARVGRYLIESEGSDG